MTLYIASHEDEQPQNELHRELDKSSLFINNLQLQYVKLVSKIQ